MVLVADSVAPPHPQFKTLSRHCGKLGIRDAEPWIHCQFSPAADSETLRVRASARWTETDADSVGGGAPALLTNPINFKGNHMKAKKALVGVLASAVVSTVAWPREAQTCYKTELHLPGTSTDNPYTCVCETWFLGMKVNTSTTPCQDSIVAYPAHRHCTEEVSEVEDCIAGVVPVVTTLQKYKCECESASGLEVEIGGVKYTIGWFRAACNTDGGPISSAVNTDASVACPH